MPDGIPLAPFPAEILCARILAARFRPLAEPRSEITAGSEVAAFVLLALDRLEERLEVALAEAE